MKIENQVVNLELSKKLKELRVVKESIFFYEWSGAKELSMNENHKPYFNIDGINTYTVAELGEMLPDSIYDEDLYTSKHRNNWSVEYMNLPEDKPECLRSLSAKTEANARAKMLIWLIENKHINPKEI